jgi:hypothetical protein
MLRWCGIQQARGVVKRKTNILVNTLIAQLSGYDLWADQEMSLCSL